MNKYLEKIAREYYSQSEVADTRVGSALGGALVGGLTAHQANKRIGNVIQRHFVAPMLSQTPTVSQEVMDKIVADALPRTNTVMDIRKAGGSQAASSMMEPFLQGPSYITSEGLNSAQKRMHFLGELSRKAGGKVNNFLGRDAIPNLYSGQLSGTPTFNKNFISMPGKVTNTDVLAHELGHAVDFSKGPVGLKKAVSGAGRLLHGVPAAAIGGLALTNENTRDYAWMAPVLAAAPTLREEIAANVHAYDLVKKHGGDAGKLKGLFTRNLTSYSIPMLAAAGSLAGVNYLRRKGEEVHPDEWLKDRE
jgi:hypothetical protein